MAAPRAHIFDLSAANSLSYWALDVRVLSGRDHCWKIESLAVSTVTGLGQPRPAVSGRTGLLLYRIEPQV